LFEAILAFVRRPTLFKPILFENSSIPFFQVYRLREKTYFLERLDRDTHKPWSIYPVLHKTKENQFLKLLGLTNSAGG
jgi:hypothetical protein